MREIQLRLEGRPVSKARLLEALSLVDAVPVRGSGPPFRSRSKDATATPPEVGVPLRLIRRSRRVQVGAGGLDVCLVEGAVEIDGCRRPVCDVILSTDACQALPYLFDLARRLVREQRFCVSTPGPIRRAMAFPDLSCILASASVIATSTGPFHPEPVHQLRVGLRRLRTILKELGARTHALNPSWETSLKTVSRALGLQRDLALLSDELAPDLQAEEPAEGLVWPGPRPSARAASRAVRDPCFQSTLLDLLACGLQSPASRPVPASSLPLLKKRLTKLHRQLVVDGQRFAGLSQAQQHRFRKRLKRLRCLSEFARPWFEGRRVDRYLQRLSPLQEALSAHQDQVMALARWRSLPPTTPGHWLVVGWFIARRDQTLQDCLDALRNLHRIRRFW